MSAVLMRDRKHFTVEGGPFVIAHESSGLGSDLIRMYRRTPYTNHVSVWYPQVGPELFEARSATGVTGPGHKKARTLQQAVEGGDRVALYAVPKVAPSIEEEAIRFLLHQVGKGYDHLGIAGFVPLPFGLGKHTGRQERRKQSGLWICSEYIQAWSQKRETPLAGTRWKRPGPTEQNPFDLRHQPFDADYVDPYRVDPEWAVTSPILYRVA